MDKASLAQLTLALCKIPSVTGNEQAIANHIERVLRHKSNLSVQRVGHALIAEGPVRQGRPTIALLGHTDTVPESADQTCLLDEQQQRVFGCGASDMKAGLAVMLALLDQVHAFQAFNVKAVFYDREEGPVHESGLEPLCQQGHLSNVDLAICLEPTDGNIEAGCMGSIHAQITFAGKRAHSARPWQGKNAIGEALPFLAQLQSFGKQPVEVQGLTFYEVMNATKLHAGIASNVIPDLCTVHVNYRFAPHRSLDQALAFLECYIPKGVPFIIEATAPAGIVHASHPLVSAWQKKQGLSMTAKQAWTDVARLSQHGVAAINFGPGETAQAHQANESTPTALLAFCYDSLHRLLSG